MHRDCRGNRTKSDTHIETDRQRYKEIKREKRQAETGTETEIGPLWQNINDCETRGKSCGCDGAVGLCLWGVFSHSSAVSQSQVKVWPGIFLLRPVLTLAACACDPPHIQLSSVSLQTHSSPEAVAKLDVLLKLATTLNTQSPNNSSCSLELQHTHSRRMQGSI